MIKKLLKTHEFILLIVLIILSLFIGLKNPAFFNLGNVFGLARNMVVLGFLSIGMFLVIVSKGIDVSSPVIAAFSMYVTAKLFIFMPQASFLLVLVCGALLGALLGILNGFLVSYFGLPVLIVTLGTASFYRGFLQSVIGTSTIHELPQSLIAFSQKGIFRFVSDQGAVYYLPISFLLFVLFFIIMAVIMSKTMFGRVVFAIGGDQESARRVGIKVKSYIFSLYPLVGMFAGIAGIMHISLLRNSHPFDLVGYELDVIAACVLGGVSLAGGRGSLFGVFIGLILITVVNNSLILLGISSQWQKFALGLILLVSVSATSYSRMMMERRHEL